MSNLIVVLMGGLSGERKISFLTGKACSSALKKKGYKVIDLDAKGYFVEKLRKLKLNLAGKTGTTNENTDAWFIGFTSNYVIGVYVGMDNPQSLGKFETGSKTALPIFESFIKNAVKKSDARPFKVSDGITMMIVDSKTGQKAKFTSKNTIIEVFKKKNVVDGKVLYSNSDRMDINNILKFY